MVSIQTLTAAAALFSMAVAAPTPSQARTEYTAPTGNGSFDLMAIAYDGDLSLSGLWLSVGGAHSGAATVEPFFYKQQTPKSDIGYYFNSTTGDIFYNSYPGVPFEGAPFHLYSFASAVCGFDNDIDVSTIPANYSCVQEAINDPQYHFSFNQETNMVKPSSYKDVVLGVCPLKVYPRPGIDNSTVYGFMSRPKGSKRAKGCADVHLKAIF